MKRNQTIEKEKWWVKEHTTGRPVKKTDERGSSVVECRSNKRESPGSNPLCYRFEVWAFSFSSRGLSRLSCINKYLAIDSGGHVSEQSLRNCCMARMLPREAELVSE